MSNDPGASPPASRPKLEGDLLVSIGEILAVLVDVSNGDLSRRLEPRYPDTHPIGALTESVNTMMEALADAKAQSQTYVAELQEKLAAIERQQAAIQELSTPIIEVWKGVLCVPIVGVLDSTRTAEMTSNLLAAVVQKKARCALIDITGIEVMDTKVVDHFLRMARAVRLLGAQCVLSGIHPNISLTIVQMGIDFQGIESHRTMRDALRKYISTTVPKNGASAGPTDAAPTGEH
jgi:rsbT co-antagonist protein RsbR